MIKAAARLQPFSLLEFNRCVAAGSQSMNLDSGVELCNMKLLRALVNLSLTMWLGGSTPRGTDITESDLYCRGIGDISIVV